MICKYCGMDSTTTDKCSWCGRELTASPVTQEETDATPAAEAVTDAAAETETEDATAPLQLAPVTAKAQPASKGLRPAPGVPPPGSRKRAPVPARPVPTTRAASTALSASDRNPALARATALNANLAMNDTAEAALETPPIFATTPSASEAGEEAVLSPNNDLVETEPTIIVTDILATPLEAVEAGTEGEAIPTVKKKRRRPVRDEDIMGVSSTFLLTRYIVVMALIFIITGGLSYLLHDRTGERFSGWAIGPLLAAEFLGGLLLPLLRIGPWIDDDAEDLVWFVLFTLMFGPVVSLICYGILCLLRHSYNASLLGCMAVAAVARFGLMVTTHDYNVRLLTPFYNPSGWTFSFMFINWMGFVALLGWYVASVFRGLDQ